MTGTRFEKVAGSRTDAQLLVSPVRTVSSPGSWGQKPESFPSPHSGHLPQDSHHSDQEAWKSLKPPPVHHLFSKPESPRATAG